MAADYVQEQIIQAGEADFSSKSAEDSIISRMLAKGSEAASRASELSPEDFYYPENAKLYRAILAVLAKRMAVDLVTVDAAIGELYPTEKDVLTQTMVETLRMQFQAYRNIGDYIQIVKALSARRRSIKCFEGIMAQLHDPTRSVADILSQAQTEASRIVTSSHNWQSLQDVLVSTYEYIEKRQQGQIKAITTGIGNIDRLIGGFYGGELTVIGARPSVGKSAFGANIALAAARDGFRVSIVSREMTDVQYGARILSHASWVDGMKLRKCELDADDWNKMAESLADVGGLPIDFMFNVRTIEDLVSEVKRKAERGEIDMLIVDYLQLVETERRFQQEHLRVGYISANLKHLATDCNIPVIALAQVNRDTDGQMPSLKSLKASGDIEQDADGVIFLHRPSHANDPYVDARDREAFGTYEARGLTYLCIGVAKQRQGATGMACVVFDPSTMRYIEIDRTSGR